MGMRLIYIQEIEKAIRLAGYSSFDGLKMVELGNQHMRNNEKMLKMLNERGIKKSRASKQFYKAMGFKHVSIDLNGSDGAQKYDLSKVVNDTDLTCAFDVLTNSGTSEHVKKQYECFLNCHQFIKKGGVMIHIVPQTDSWKGHGEHYYRNAFFVKLAELCKYEVLTSKVLSEKPSGLVVIALKKTEESMFPNREDFKNAFKLNDRE